MIHDVYHMNFWPEDDTPEGSIQDVARRRFNLTLVEHISSPVGVCDVVDGDREDVVAFVTWLFQDCEDDEDFVLAEYLPA